MHITFKLNNMKRTCLFLLILILVVYLKEGYEKITAEAPTKCIESANLSDLAQNVTAIPLETTPHCIIRHARQVKKDRDHLFLVNQGKLYHFSTSGKFLNQITHSELEYKNNILVSEYVIDPIQKQLIVMDGEQNVHYYSYEGNFLGKINIMENRPWISIKKIAYHDQHIWATVDRVVPQKGEKCLEQWLYKLDTIFNEVDAHKITPVDVGRFTLGREVSPEIAVVNEKVYAQSPSHQPEYLLQDTMYLLSQDKHQITGDYPFILPFRISGRFLISTYYNTNSKDKNYTFCYDLEKKQAYYIKEGLEDNFYETGQIQDLQAMDVYSNSFCFYKSGKDVLKAFPNRKESDNPVLFIVKLKA